MSEAYDTYYGSNIDSWLDDFESHALEFAQDILSELPTWALALDKEGKRYTPTSWAYEQRKIVEASEPIQSFLRLVEMYVDEDEEEEEEESEDDEEEEAE